MPIALSVAHAKGSCERAVIADLGDGEAEAVINLGGTVGAPAPRFIEAAGPVVVFEHPERGSVEAELGESVEGCGHKLASEPAPPQLGQNVDGVDLAGAARVVVSGGPDAGEATDPAVEACDQVGLAVTLLSSEDPPPALGPRGGFESVKELLREMPGVSGLPGAHMHQPNGSSVIELCGSDGSGVGVHDPMVAGESARCNSVVGNLMAELGTASKQLRPGAVGGVGTSGRGEGLPHVASSGWGPTAAFDEEHRR